MFLKARHWLAQNARMVSTIFVSLLLHVGVVLLLALLTFTPNLREELFGLTITRSPEEPPEVIIETLEQPQKIAELDVASAAMEANMQAQPVEAPITPMALDLDDADEPTAEIKDQLAEMRIKLGEFSGRTAAGRKAGLEAYGGTVDSEASVVRGLAWLQSVQQKNGSWNFTQIGETPNAGSLDSPTGATSMALLAFLGAGHTHQKSGPYKRSIQKGISFLVRKGKTTPAGLDLRGTPKENEGMYVQGLATIALCEALGMAPKDTRLRTNGQLAIDFVRKAQHPEGGWRYNPGQRGDTSVVGWQVMALHSGRAAQLKVPDEVFGKTHLFLNDVQADGGAQYGYTNPQPNRKTTTAVGLLCRMYMGWKRNNPALKRGVAYLSRTGPDRNDMYYNYYATQVLHHWGGKVWHEWNNVLREQLVLTQEKDGPAAGSWRPAGSHSNKGGRIYQTTLSLMTLEVYYRHLPLYRRRSTSVDL